MKKILVVDDEKEILNFFGRILKEYEVELVDTIEEAEKKLKTNYYDLVITDLRLSGVDGEEGFYLAKFIKEYNKNTKVILITGYGSPQVMEQAYKYGVDIYLQKPLKADSIRGAIKLLIEK